MLVSVWKELENKRKNEKVNDICLTSRGSAVRTRVLPHIKLTLLSSEFLFLGHSSVQYYILKFHRFHLSIWVKVY